jgi:hypothetical protein
MKRRLFDHGRSFEVDPVAGRLMVRPLRVWYLVAATGCAGVALAPWLVTRVGPLQLTPGGWLMVLAYGVAALGLGWVGLSPSNRFMALDLREGVLEVGAPFGLGRRRRLRLLELRFGYRERLLPIGDVVACKATVAHPAIGELTIVETTRDHKRLPKRTAHALEQARRDGDGAHLTTVAEEITAARGLGWYGWALVAGLLALGPAWLWWYLG